jgi:hypothetical protein
MTITLPHKHAKLADEDKRETHLRFSFAKPNQNKKSYKAITRKGSAT